MSDDLVGLAMRWAARLNESEDEEDNRIGAVIDALLDRDEAQEAEIRSLREQVAKAEAAEHRARLEGAEVMREAAARVIRSGMHNEYARPQPALTAAVLALDPAAILEAHTRAKAMDKQAGDADTL